MYWKCLDNAHFKISDAIIPAPPERSLEENERPQTDIFPSGSVVSAQKVRRVRPNQYIIVSLRHDFNHFTEDGNSVDILCNLITTK